MMRVRALLTSTSLLLLAIACGPKPGERATAAPPSSGAATTGAPAIIANETEDALRARALATVDSGDILAADKLLRELARRRATSVGTRGIIKALESCALKEALKNCMLENFNAIDVTPLPPPSSSKEKEKGGRVTAKPLPRDASDPSADAAVFHAPRQPPVPSYVRRLKGVPAEANEKPEFLPATFGGSTLLFTKWTGKNWLAVYGRAMRDGRFVAVVDASGRPVRVLDFRAWRAAQNALAEIGIVSVDMLGDVVYVKQESNASEGYLAAVDSTTGKTLWRSEGVGMSTHFVVGDEHVVVWTYGGMTAQSTPYPQGFKLLDRATGDVVTRIPTTYVVFAIMPADSAVIAYGGGPGLTNTNRVEIKTPARHIDPPKEVPPPPKEGVLRLATLKSDPADTKARLDAWATLDTGRILEGIVALRTIFDRRPGSLAVEALLGAAMADAEEQRERAREALRGANPTKVSLAAAPKGTKAPIPRTRTTPPKLRLVEEKETRRHRSSWFSDAGITPNKFELDERPSGAPILPAPLWLPPNRTEEMTTPKGEQTVAVYGAAIAVYRPDKLVGYFEIDPVADLSVRFADAIGDVVLLSGEGRGKGSLVAFDMKSGKLLWRTPNVIVSSFVLVDGYIIASTEPIGQKPEYLVLEGDTGRIVSRSTTPHGIPSFPNRLARDGTTLWAFSDIMTARFTIE